MKSQEKRIISGNYLEVEHYPVTEHGYRHDRKYRLSRTEQQNLNQKNAVKKMTRLINTNFGLGDLLIHGTYRPDEMPKSEKEVLNDIQNYFRRINRYRKSHGMPRAKYIYVIECSSSGNWHWHGIMSGMNRNIAEELWGHGDFTNANRFQPTVQTGGEAFAKYISKKPKGKRRWNCSKKNLKKPTVKTKSSGYTRRGIARIARERADDTRYWERKYKGYRLVSVTPVYNEFNGWWYIYIKMYRDTRGINSNERKQSNMSVLHK